MTEQERKEEQGCMPKMRCCGNCVMYIWDKDFRRHYGDCVARKDYECCHAMMMINSEGLHALYGTKMCDRFELGIGNN